MITSGGKRKPAKPDLGAGHSGRTTTHQPSLPARGDPPTQQCQWDPVATRLFSPARRARPVLGGDDRADDRTEEGTFNVLIEAGQVAVVTGAAQGLGCALATGFIGCVVSVVLADTATERLQTTAEEFTARDGQCRPVITDVVRR